MSSAAESSPARRRMSKEARRSQLLANAKDAFGQLGYSGTTMEDIAARSGVARSLLYEHFESLDELYLECVRDVQLELDGRLIAAAALPGDPEGRLRAGVRAYFTFVQDHGTDWDVLFASSPTPSATVGRATARLRFRTAEQIAALLMAELPALEPGEAHTYAQGVTGAGEQLARWWRQNPEISLETVVDRMMAIVWFGMRDRFGGAGR